ncbi:hypothetical protein RRG08_056363 [Elysia crispata]|uniref:Uncharacterized protein n=1 Tax=Elysia crispata TaxID=231223 RepID=A0AAE0YPC8_9GAST|nr:hypothetical protein RRG08_056363 [Elysia crispata]
MLSHHMLVFDLQEIKGSLVNFQFILRPGHKFRTLHNQALFFSLNTGLDDFNQTIFTSFCNCQGLDFATVDLVERGGPVRNVYWRIIWRRPQASPGSRCGTVRGAPDLHPSFSCGHQLL